MGSATWPELGPYPDPLDEHTNKLREDIKPFESFLAHNKDSMQPKTYKILMNSFTTICEKILRQPTSTRVFESVENVRNCGGSNDGDRSGPMRGFLKRTAIGDRVTVATT